MRRLSNTEAELKKSVAYKKMCTYSEPALLVDGLVCYFVIHFLESIREKSKALKKNTSLIH